MREDGPAHRWGLWLPAAGVLAAAGLVVLGAAASRALEDRRALALEGRLLRLAFDAEHQLREGEPLAAEELLERRLAVDAGTVLGLALIDAAGDVEIQVGAMAAGDFREVELHLGPGWQTARGAMHGRRRLRIAFDPAVRGLTPGERLLLPGTALAAVVLAALSVLGGRLLTRQQREQRSEAVRRRLEGLARAGAGLAHQLRTPLATIKGSCQLMLESDAAVRGRRLQAAVGEVERMEKMLQQLLDYARPPAAEPATVDLAAATAQLAEIDPRLELRVPRGLAARVDPEHLRGILDNVIENALQASPDSQPVELTAEARGRFVELRFADRGPGPGDDPESLFEPYVSRRAHGTGLGLPIARALAEANGGRLDLVPRPGGGTVARLLIPRGEESA